MERVFSPTHLALVVTLSFVFGSTGESGEPKSPWLTDYEKARTTARKLGKPMFIVFR